MTSILTGRHGTLARNFLREFFGRLSIRRDAYPLDTVAALGEFVATRSAFVAQKTLYGYLKTRMGTRYPSMFENDVFVRSIDIAKMHIFAACLSDLTVFAVAHALRDAPPGLAERRALALRFYGDGMSENAAGAPEEFSATDAIEAFSQRTAETDWQGAALDRDIFMLSQPALYRWAPIAPELKSQDADIVENSINFTWSEIRQIFLRRLDAGAVLRDHAQSL